jgi:hypothetical protein
VHDLADAVGISVRNLRAYLKEMQGISHRGVGAKDRTGAAGVALGKWKNKARPERKYKR